MSEQFDTAVTRTGNARDLGRSQAIFVATGICIILGGLYFLAQGDGPYHPEISGDEAQFVIDS
ncbi:hypothetical protein [Sulfitobacter aestuariivivens]|uniref:Uncharacterized protein n=1 Tax=Sulfitobacter aestuariivivens TaxID=2766981 RepID=A0A927D5L2_9RHOB|nr:hypothetical protein [Sulfitobacter aestuariivivens]MBD3665610.1 hypothetical protein [Sulfitobacter aestuariivivens]